MDCRCRFLAEAQLRFQSPEWKLSSWWNNEKFDRIRFMKPKKKSRKNSSCIAFDRWKQNGITVMQSHIQWFVQTGAPHATQCSSKFWRSGNYFQCVPKNTENKKIRIRNVITQQQHLSVDDCSTTQHHPVALWCIIGRSIANWQSARVRCAPTTAHNNLNTNTHTRIKVTAQIIPTDAHTHNGAARIAKEEKRQSSAVSCCLRSTVI